MYVKLVRNILNISENNKKLELCWLIQSVGALAIAGLFALFLVVARTPDISKLFPYKDLFKTTLTIHVNLSVLIWLTSMSCTIFSARTKFIKLGYLSFAICALGTIIIACSIFDVSAEAFLNNYIPVLGSEVFRAGIFIYFAGLFLASLQIFGYETDSREIYFFNITSFFIILAAFITLFLTWHKLELPANHGVYNYADYYEKLFWGFGHIVQFLYTNTMMIALFLLVSEITGITSTTPSKIFSFLFNCIFACTGVFIIYKFDVTSVEYTQYFTRQMIMFGGLAPLIAIITILPLLIFKYSSFTSAKPQRNAIIWCIILFIAGGIISTFIRGSNTIIPAHYHGVIIGISVLFTGLCYQILPKLGYAEIKGRLANIQPILYGSGQLIHITGFALSGGYGAMRKTPGVELPTQAKVYMGLMGMGGLISIIGGLFFVIIIFKTLIKGKETI